jgi:hypothetical protein
MHARAEIQNAILGLPVDDQTTLREWVLQTIPKPASALPDRSLAEILPRFQDMVTHLNIQWQMYEDLFRTEHYPIFNNTACTFFYHLRWYLFDGLISSIARFLDPPGNRHQEIHQEILSLERICLLSDVAGMRPELTKQLDDMKILAKPGIGFWRNNVCAHANLQTVLREIDIPKVHVDELRDLVTRISAFAHQLTLIHSNVGHEFHVNTGWHWVSLLLEDLEAGIAQRQARLAEQAKRFHTD